MRGRHTRFQQTLRLGAILKFKMVPLAEPITVSPRALPPRGVRAVDVAAALFSFRSAERWNAWNNPRVYWRFFVSLRWNSGVLFQRQKLRFTRVITALFHLFRLAR